MRIDNSQVVREHDPRASRDLWWLLVLVMTLVAGLVLYAWPHLEIRETSRAQERMSRERERLLEENRKLRLEKASLQNLRRVEAIATRELGLQSPAAQQVVVVERPRVAAPGGQLAKEMGSPATTPSSAAGERN
jgi:cell division protein FtsL